MIGVRRCAFFVLVSAFPGCEQVPTQPVCEAPLADRIEADRMLAHLEALQVIADEHANTRASGTAGYDASVDYVTEQLELAGYEVTLHAFEFRLFSELSPSQLDQTAPAVVVYDNGVDFATGQFSGAGEVTAAVEAVDLELGLGNTSTSACEPEDFDGFTSGNIALVQRGSCNFAQKVANAQEAGATAVLIFNQGDSEDRLDLVAGTLDRNSPPTIPVVFTTYALGETLSALAPEGLELHVLVDAETRDETAQNIIADSPTGDPSNVVMLGAHLDSVPAGPGINDNGSGSVTLLEIARQLQDCTPTNRVRFAWWGAEEYGLIGSNAWVADRSESEIADLGVYLNFDMVASPNYVHFVYDTDGSSFDGSPPGGSAALEALFRDYFGEQGIEAKDSPLNGRSDYAAFLLAGVPVGGTFTGAEGSKSTDEADQFGGTPQEAYDPCYHQACDTEENVALDALRANARAAAYAVEKLAADLSPVGR